MEELDAVLAGRGWDVQERYDAVPESAQPVRLRRNACYVVLALLFNDQGEVLMMQEAKAECHGMWYLPAGRMEPNETIVEAMRREVKEETGLECDPLTLLAVEERGPAWIRFVFLAEPTGGSLKTLQEADAESLQARWWDRESPTLPLRAPDILPLLDLAARYRTRPSHPPTLPAEMPCTRICQRLLAAFTNSTGDLWVLMSTAGALHLPVMACGTTPSEMRRGLRASAARLLRECILLGPVTVAAQGLLGLQHLGKEAGKADGVCFNVLLMVGHGDQSAQGTPPELRDESFQWWRVTEGPLRSTILQRLSSVAVVALCS
ncbi:PREDICTED: 8-oxo-dGDP phosphatase NUDT18 [Gavialis gangeticus]|uniref:8-oxo-dGDP phosphatase NUDT18 n=1 Tax=Gavialis gangeticus TaxID=94835 RepID=UPI00092E764E|nr:PREDICTED: 8-oxo-dGDP phosphatase NUDT18 [Gavialis gangeticus]